MAALHDALTNLSPIDWSDVPQDNPESYVDGILKAAELIICSVPPPAGGTPFAESRPSTSEPNTATSHHDMTLSEARSLAPAEEYEELQSSWGKPQKFSQKENPLGVAVYKMAGKDRHGGWFARRSVHEGIGFSQFRDAMKREFEQSLQVEGGAGAGCIRGIGADKKLEHLDIGDSGQLEVFQLSAQFPGPTTPRDFITMVISSESALGDKSVSSSGITAGHIPRHFIVVSRPVKHPEAPDRSGYIRGQYESVELIREIPLQHDKSKSTPNLLANESSSHDEKKRAAVKRSKSDSVHETNDDESAATDERELNPVEWIMVTRSDPGGGIPRFMVDRGTPSAMITDLHKFLDWAARPDGKAVDEGGDVQQPATADSSQHVGNAATDTTAPHDPAKSGFLQRVTNTLEAGLDAYAPAMVSSFVHGKLDAQPDDDDSSDISDSSDSFTSATERRASPRLTGSSDNLSLASLQAASDDPHHKLDSHPKKLLELAKQREKLDSKLAKKRAEEEERLSKARETEESESTKAQEHFDKEMRKQEDKHRKEVEKLEARKAKEDKKLEQKRQKQLDRDALHKLTRERDEFRSQVDLLKRENAVLRERIEHLERAAKVESENA